MSKKTYGLGSIILFAVSGLLIYLGTYLFNLVPNGFDRGDLKTGLIFTGSLFAFLFGVVCFGISVYFIIKFINGGDKDE